MPIGKPIPITVDTRFIAGTNRNLRELVQRGKFRQDLYFRLNIVRVVVPPLRQRTEDIPLLLDYFAAHYARHYKRDEIQISPAIRSLLMGYPWPGNVRELAAWVERLYATGLDAEVLVEALLMESDKKQEKLPIDGMTLRQLERCAIEQAMDRTDFNQRKAARLLHVHRATLSRKLKRHGLK